MKIIEDPNMVVQVRFPKTRKKRILKKWSKNPTNFEPSADIFIKGDKYICHPMVADAIKQLQKSHTYTMRAFSSFLNMI